MKVVECKEVTKRYGDYKALKNLSFSLAENKITGLIGRNGAGKTTLLKIIAGFLKHTSGDVQVFLERPFNSLKVSANSIFVDLDMNFPPALTLEELLHTAGSFYPNWDHELAVRLFNYFSFNPSASHGNLSKGMKSTFNIIVGLAARCPLTIFDEPTSGMDSGVRKDFYRAVLKDYLAYPRTIILSSHLVEEVEDLLEDILLINKGEIYLHMPVEDLKEYAVGISGRSEDVEKVLAGKKVIFKENAGTNRTYAVIKRDEDIEKAIQLGLELSPVSIDNLCLYLTSKSTGGIDHVFS
jgi:ABC-2 type transport system ATP-binding protein